MSNPKFAVGQFVDFESNARLSRAAGPYEVMRVLPVDGANSPLYHVKSKVEPFERAASERDLVLAGLEPRADAAAMPWPARRRRSN